ncbi:MAG: helix-turn-helix transcriptional regulator [Nanoarchaeota archaeon]
MDIDENKIELSKAKLSLLEAYFQKIRTRFPELNTHREIFVFSSLEKIVNNLGNTEKSTTKELDKENLEKIRKEAGLTQKELAMQLGINDYNICRYERGGLCYPPTGRKMSKYVEWLKERGYNF